MEEVADLDAAFDQVGASRADVDRHATSPLRSDRAHG
jgi:hypothetical protein